MNARFSTYACFWIKQSIRRAVNNAKTIRLPFYMIELLNKWRKATAELHKRYDRPPTEEEVADHLGLSKKKRNIIRKAIQVYNAGTHGDADDESWAFDELMMDNRARQPETRAVESDLLEHVLALVGRLEPRRRTCCGCGFGLKGEEPLTLKEIGERLGLTREPSPSNRGIGPQQAERHRAGGVKARGLASDAGLYAEGVALPSPGSRHATPGLGECNAFGVKTTGLYDPGLSAAPRRTSAAPSAYRPRGSPPRRERRRRDGASLRPLLGRMAPPRPIDSGWRASLSANTSRSFSARSTRGIIRFTRQIDLVQVVVQRRVVEQLLQRAVALAQRGAAGCAPRSASGSAARCSRPGCGRCCRRARPTAWSPAAGWRAPGRPGSAIRSAA